MKLNFTVILTILLLSAPASYALDDTNVLPPGIRNLSLKFGEINGLDQTYTESGDLKYLSEVNSFVLDSEFLAEADERAIDLIEILNQFGTYEIGNQINMGEISLVANPKVTYTVPMFLYGFNKRFTGGIAVPIVNFKNSVAVTRMGSNLPQLQDEFAGFSTELDEAFAELEEATNNAVTTQLQEKGYKALNPKNETFIGDIVLVNVYQIPGSKPSLSHQTQLRVGLPTGPEPDADDLTDIESFHRWSLQPVWISKYRFHKNFYAVGSTSYKMILPQDVEKRVPTDSNDLLPGIETKRGVTEDLGDIWTATGAFVYSNEGPISIGAAYGIEMRDKNKYSGVSSTEESLLSKNTRRQAQLIKTEFEYSTTKSYLRGESWIPAKISYEISQVIAGKNIDNETVHEVFLNVYF